MLYTIHDIVPVLKHRKIASISRVSRSLNPREQCVRISIIPSIFPPFPASSSTIIRCPWNSRSQGSDREYSETNSRHSVSASAEQLVPTMPSCLFKPYKHFLEAGSEFIVEFWENYRRNYDDNPGQLVYKMCKMLFHYCALKLLSLCIMGIFFSNLLLLYAPTLRKVITRRLSGLGQIEKECQTAGKGRYGRGARPLYIFLQRFKGCNAH